MRVVKLMKILFFLQVFFYLQCFSLYVCVLSICRACVVKLIKLFS